MTSTGAASGWSAYREPTGRGWQWTAYAPSGSEMGWTKTKEEAQARAQEAVERLKRILPPRRMDGPAR